ncbi:antimicrobial response protein [Lithospermum erythrorhizon]|uniref:Antimicrobial response protein n=1 Tax=Lithospermum erythrorhizon TaxID=34254 RepID=A0AAV3NQZ7_LITER
MDSILTFVLNNISNVINEEITLLGGLGGELQSIKDELQQMMEFLKGADSLVEAHPDVRSWVHQVRDVAYDTEDILEEFMIHCTYPHYRGLYGRARKVKIRLKALKAQHQLASRIQDIKNRISNISEAHARYQIRYGMDERRPSDMPAISRRSDRRGDALFLEEADLVGIEKPKREVTEMLFSDDSRRSVISVVGMGGLGKTTLVKQVYDDVYVKSQFSHYAWITVSESFKMEDLFKQAIRQLFHIDGQQLPHDLDAMDINGLKQEVHKFLQSKRYLVVFDDVWKPTDWHAIHMAFPRNREGSRVVITTRNFEICQAASNTEEKGFIYLLPKLFDEEARKLFCRKAFNGATSCPKHLKEICQKFLKACDGLPLAIVVVGSILASKSPRTEEWDLFYRNSGEELEHHSITKHDMTAEEVAESYLNELISRSLLQVANFKDHGNIKAIRIHDMVRQLILRKSREQNITSILREQDQMIGFQDKVRRLAIHGCNSCNTEQPKKMCKSLRSLVLFEFNGASTIQKPFLSTILRFSGRLIKVLDLRGAPLTDIPDEIFNLILLKYLSLRNTKVCFIPKSIRKLQNLETLDLKGTHVDRLPIQILQLHQLRHLLVYSYQKMIGYLAFDCLESCKIPYKISNLKSLQKISYIEAERVGDFKIVNEIGKLVQLRSLGITKLRKEDGIELCSSLEKLIELRSLVIVAMSKEEVIDLQCSLSSSALTFLRFLELRGRLEKLPQWISSLHGLTRVTLGWSRLRDKDPLKFLQDLPNLVQLDLDRAYEGEGLNFRAGGFLSLKVLTLVSLHGLSSVRMEEGAMPLLENLWIAKCQSMEKVPIGIEYLRHLKDLEFSDMSDAFVKELKIRVANMRIIHVPRLVISNWIDGRWQAHLFNKKTGLFL